jgi:hypothetical protein
VLVANRLATGPGLLAGTLRASRITVTDGVTPLIRPTGRGAGERDPDAGVVRLGPWLTRH